MAMKYTYRVDVYASNKTMAISAWEDGNVPYGVCTLNLEEYDVTPLPGYIFVPAYKISREFLQNIVSDLGDPEYKPLPFGIGPFNARMYLMKLREDWPEVLNVDPATLAALAGMVQKGNAA